MQNRVIYVPLAEILDYDEELYELSGGQASYSMVFERYELVPEYLIDIEKGKRK